MIPRIRSRLEQVLDDGCRREDTARQELGRAIAAVAAQQERALAAELAVEEGLGALSELMSGTSELHHLRASHEDLSLARGRAAHERTTAARLEAAADERRADLVRATPNRQGGRVVDELAMRKAARIRPGMAA